MNNWIKIKSLHSIYLLVGFALASATLPLSADSLEATIISPASAITVAAKQTIGFSATSDDSVGRDQYSVSSFGWSFGDGTTGAGNITSHAYVTPGTYTATLTVTYTYAMCKRMDLDGNCYSWLTKSGTATATRTITVLALPKINSFSASATSVGVGKPVTLSWATTDATTLSISGVGLVSGTSVVVYPTTATNYILTASNSIASGTSSLTITTYTVGISISPGSVQLLFGESTNLVATVTPANLGVGWSATGLLWPEGGGTPTGNTATVTGFVSGKFLVTATSLEDGAKSATSMIDVATVSVGTPVPNPSSARTFVGGGVSFSALVSNAMNTGVTWSVNGGGSIDSSGLFRATSQGTFTVTATSAADHTKSATTQVTVAPLTVTITPNNPTIRGGQIQQFNATVAGPGTPSQEVTWSIVSEGGGTITTPGGLYTAPSTSGNFTVQATSVQDTSCAGTAVARVPGWVLKSKRDIVYLGTKEIAEIDLVGTKVTLLDHLGSPRFSWDGVAPAGGTPDGVHLIHQKFMPFGESLSDPASASKFAKGFTNHEQTDPSGLIYMQARFYAPWYGRFLSPDPARDQHFEETQSWNIYSYVQNNPTMHIDPTGMFDWEALGNRGIGVLKVVGAMAEGAAGTALIAGTSGAGAIPGALVLGHAADVGGAGLRQIWSGKSEQSLTSQGIQTGLETAGMSTANAHATAEVTDGLISVGNTLAGARQVLGLNDAAKEAPKSEYSDVTEKGSRYSNRKTDVPRSEFESNLKKDGYAASTSKDGKVNTYTKGKTTYSTRGNAKSTGKPSADVTVDGKLKTKIRLPEDKK